MVRYLLTSPTSMVAVIILCNAPPNETYTVKASKTGFHEETQQVVVHTNPVTLDFCGETWLIPDGPDVFYVLDCVVNWQYWPAVACCKLDVLGVLDIVSAWQYPIT